VARVKGTSRGLAISVDCSGRFCYLDPYRGAMLAVAESARNVACAGGEPIGATNNLNFGNPERPEIMWQLGEAVRGIGDACRALDIPITGGNVSLYNETDGEAIYPTPVIGVVGLLDDYSKTATRQFKSSGDRVVLRGDNRGELGGSEYLALLHDRVAGEPPALDLAGERALQRLLVQVIGDQLVRSAHDCAEGGLAVTIAECCFETGLGAQIDLPLVTTVPDAFRHVATLFGESATRVIVSVAPDRVDALARAAATLHVPCQAIGHVGGDRVTIGINGRTVVDIALEEAEHAWSTSIERQMTRRS
jgi:phosphoribosylformylglycinamidine synthase